MSLSSNGCVARTDERPPNFPRTAEIAPRSEDLTREVVLSKSCGISSSSTLDELALDCIGKTGSECHSVGWKLSFCNNDLLDELRRIAFGDNCWSSDPVDITGNHAAPTSLEHRLLNFVAGVLLERWGAIGGQSRST